MKYVLVALSVLMLASCEHQVPEPVAPISFEGPVYKLDVSRIDVVDDYPPAPAGQRPENRPKVTLADAMHQWSNKRLSAVGPQNVLELHITSAQILKKEIPKQKTGIEGLFTKEQTEEYEGQLSVELRLYSPERTLPVAHAEVTAQLTHSLREDATVEDRKLLYHTMTAELMGEITKTLDQNIQTYFGKYLK